MSQDLNLSIPFLVTILRHIKYGADILLSDNARTGPAASNLEDINTRIAEEVITLAYFMKLKTLESNLIKTQIMSAINRDNCIKYAQYALLHLSGCKDKYKDFKETFLENPHALDPNLFLDELECES